MYRQILNKTDVRHRAQVRDEYKYNLSPYPIARDRTIAKKKNYPNTLSHCQLNYKYHTHTHTGSGHFALTPTTTTGVRWEPTEHDRLFLPQMVCLSCPVQCTPICGLCVLGTS